MNHVIQKISNTFSDIHKQIQILDKQQYSSVAPKNAIRSHLRISKNEWCRFTKSNISNRPLHKILVTHRYFWRNQSAKLLLRENYNSQIIWKVTKWIPRVIEANIGFVIVCPLWQITTKFGFSKNIVKTWSCIQHTPHVKVTV